MKGCVQLRNNQRCGDLRWQWLMIGDDDGGSDVEICLRMERWQNRTDG